MDKNCLRVLVLNLSKDTTKDDILTWIDSDRSTVDLIAVFGDIERAVLISLCAKYTKALVVLMPDHNPGYLDPTMGAEVGYGKIYFASNGQKLYFLPKTESYIPDKEASLVFSRWAPKYMNLEPEQVALKIETDRQWKELYQEEPDEFLVEDFQKASQIPAVSDPKADSKINMFIVKTKPGLVLHGGRNHAAMTGISHLNGKSTWIRSVAGVEKLLLKYRRDCGCWQISNSDLYLFEEDDE